MFFRLITKILKPSLTMPTAVVVGLTAFAFSPLFNKREFMSSRISCFDTIRANKPQLIKLTNSTKEELLILIYNRQSQAKLQDQILKYEETAQQLGISKVVLVDQTDIRHLETFTRILREDIDEDDKKQGALKQPRDLQGKIKLLYVSPLYDTNKPFAIESIEELPHRVREIRRYLKINPNQQQLKKSLQAFNRTTVVKNCYNQTCIDEYKQKIRQLIEVELLKQKQQNYQFYVTTSKTEASKISSIINQSSNKQEIYIFRNDILGKHRQLYTQFQEKEGHKYENANKFMMMIRPRVHLLTRKTLSTDLFWYITTLRINTVPTFAVNNTAYNLPIQVNDSSANSQGQSWGQNKQIVWLKGHYAEVELIRKIKQKYGNNVEVLILETNVPSELFRHVYRSERYSIFNLTSDVPYPKMLIKPSLLHMDMKVWDKVTANQKVNLEEDNQTVEKNKINLGTLEGDEDTESKWGRIFEKIDKFKSKPMNYDSIKLYRQKELQINGQELIQLLENRYQGQQSNASESSRWVFRMCGIRNPCLLSVYQKYGIDVSTPVYYLDAQVQNVSINQGDYLVDNDKINPL